VIGGNAFITEPGMAAALGPIVFVIVVVGGMGSLGGAFIASLLIGFIQTFRRLARLGPLRLQHLAGRAGAAVPRHGADADRAAEGLDGNARGMKLSLRMGSSLVWVVTAVLLVVAPWIFAGSFALTLLTQMGTLAIFALSYNMLLGQGGMLSFGHAVYSGLGAYVTCTR
jgi:ABC-type branched-subunit amino acid transport system permease subunit